MKDASKPALIQFRIEIPDEFFEKIRQIISEEVGSASQQRAELLDQHGIAKALDVSVATLRRLRREGLPCKMVGKKTPRFELEKCLAWLDERDGASSERRVASKAKRRVSR
jgi:hypothetical protein